MDMTLFKGTLVRTANRSVLKVKAHSPEILLGLGIAGFIGTAVLAARATLKVEQLRKEHEKKELDLNEAIAEIVSTEDSTLIYTAQDETRDRMLLKAKNALDYAKLYAPAVGLGALSVGLILGSHGIMRRRNVALIAAYNLISDSFNNYRDRVREELGDEREMQLRAPKIVEGEEDKGEEGKKEFGPRTVHNPKYKSDYARYFDASNPNFQRNMDYNLTFLYQNQDYANDLLRTRGHLFLNEVYDMLGMPRSTAGAIVGWTFDSSRSKDNFVDFRIDAYKYNKDAPINRNGGDAILIDPNVDGIVFDLIEEK